MLNGVIQKPSEVAQGLPMLLDAIVMKGLERDPKKRFQSAMEMARAIETSGLPIARPTEVGAWVNRIAGDTLKKRARRVAEIESTGSWSASNALAASQALSQRDLTGSGSGSSQSRSAIRPRTADASSSVPVALPSDIIIETDASGSQQLPVPAIDDDEPPKKSRVGLVAVLLLLAIGGGAGVFIWRSGGVAGARERIAQWTHVEPHGKIVGSQAPSATATAKTNVATTAPIAAGDAVDLSTSPGGGTTTTTTTPTNRRFRGGTISNGDPRVQSHAPTTNAGGGGGDLNEAMQNASGGGIGVGQNAITNQAVANNGALPARPSLGQVHAAVGQVMSSARACFNPDDPPSRANVTFQSDGSVKSISVTGFAAGKPQEACVKGMLGKAHLSPFSDETYAVPVPINP